MKRLLLILLFLLLAGCGGGGNSENAAQLQSGSADPGSKAGLQLTWADTGSQIRVTLLAGQAEDLYQAAATITYPKEKYTISEISAAGGLGDPAETYFAGDITGPGRLEFGYTKRFAGPGEFGDVPLLRFSVDKTDEFSIGDFVIDFQDSPPLVRDSNKQPIDLSAEGGAR